MKLKTASTIAVLALVWLPASGRAAEEPAGGKDQPSSAGILDAEQRYPKALQFSVDGFGGSYLGASVGSSGLVGSRLLFYITRMFGIGAMYGYAALASGHDMGTVSNEAIHIVNGHVELSVDAAVRLTDSVVLEVDLYGIFGGGAMLIADNWEGNGLIGGGVRVFTGLPWLAVRIDVLNFLHRSQREDGNRFDTDVAFTLGLSFLLPPRHRAAH